MIKIRFTLACIVTLLMSSPIAILAQTGSDAEAAHYADEGQRALAQAHYAIAQADFEKLAKLEPNVAEVHATLAAICFQQREYDEAIREVRTAQKLKPGLPKLDSLLALSLAETGRFQQALPGLEKGFKQTTDAEVRRMCGLQLLRAYTGSGRDADAVETALELNKLYPDDAEILYHTGRIYGNFAYIIMEKLHDKAPDSIWMLQAQGEANESEKNYDAAIAAFDHVLELDANRPGIHYRLGRVYLARSRDAQKADDRDAAIREFTAELAIDPGNGNAGYELANLDADQGNFDAARKQYQQVLERFPDFEEALVGLAGVDLQNQMSSDAVPLLEHATRLRPEDEVAWYRLARAARISGDKEGQTKALAEFRKIHQATPGNLRAPSAMDEVTPQKLDTEAGSE
jgi:tetratricopeptide (TPR) repeat protein